MFTLSIVRTVHIGVSTSTLSPCFTKVERFGWQRLRPPRVHELLLECCCRCFPPAISIDTMLSVQHSSIARCCKRLRLAPVPSIFPSPPTNKSLKFFRPNRLCHSHLCSRATPLTFHSAGCCCLLPRGLRGNCYEATRQESVDTVISSDYRPQLWKVLNGRCRKYVMRLT